MRLFRRMQPEPPMRCQHCNDSIKPVRAKIRPLYRGTDGMYVCAVDGLLYHHPMPSVLG
jgi:uncharacterized protein with PIN domain